MTPGPEWPRLAAALSERGDATFIRLDEHTFSGTKTLDHVERAGAQLDQLGLADHETVAVFAERTASCVIALLALWSRGLVAVLVNPGEPAAARGATCAQAGCRLMLGPRADLAPGIPTLPWNTLFARDADADAERPAPSPDAPVQLEGAATVVCTSGSSGRPKLVVHGLRQHIASAENAIAVVGLERGHCWLLSLPLFHVGGLGILFRTILAGAELVIPAPSSRWEDAVVRSCPSHVSVVATQLLRLIDLLETPRASAVLPGLRAVLAGGGPVPAELRRAALDAGLPLVVSYGSTETASLVTATADPDAAGAASCAGRPLPGCEVRVSASGEVLVDGSTLLDGYLVDNAVALPRRQDGMFATGDLGRLDDSGLLFVDGRIDQMFISGGENVHPEEIEQAMLQIDGIAEVVVVPVPHETYGARPAAFVGTLPGAEVSSEAVRQRLEQWLPKFKIPDHVWPMPAGAKPGLKPDRQRLRELAAQASREQG